MPPAMLLPLLLYALPLVFGQTVHNVSVGLEGSFFEPKTVSAALGDTVNFIFYGDFHDVTQSSFDNPCTPLPGGFSSGFFGRGPDSTGNLTMWSLTITNASHPIWYFCAATRPVSHCVTSSMVGAINPSSQAMYDQFVSAAHAASTTPAFLPSLVVKGSGAIASTPTVILTAAPSASASTSSSLSNTSSISVPEITPSSSSSTNRGAIIGGSVGAVVGIIILFSLGLFLCYRLKRNRRVSQGSSFFSYNPRPDRPNNSSMNTAVSGMSTLTTPSNSPNYITAFDVERDSNVMMQKQPLLPMGSPARPDHTLTPQRYSPGKGLNHSPGLYGTPPMINRQVSFNALTPPSGPSSHLPVDTSGHSSITTGDAGIDIQTLAKEVAAVLQHEKKSANEIASSLASSSPPRYHTVTNP